MHRSQTLNHTQLPKTPFLLSVQPEEKLHLELDRDAADIRREAGAFVITTFLVDFVSLIRASRS